MLYPNVNWRGLIVNNSGVLSCHFNRASKGVFLPIALILRLGFVPHLGGPKRAGLIPANKKSMLARAQNLFHDTCTGRFAFMHNDIHTDQNHTKDDDADDDLVGIFADEGFVVAYEIADEG